MKSLIDEFRKFVMRGNVVDMAVGVIIGAAFSKIINSVVDDLFMPILGMILGGIDLSRFNIVIKPQVLDEAGNIISDAVSIKFGSFLSSIIDFLIVAIILFIVMKAFNKATSLIIKAEEEKKEEKGPSTEELLSQILEEMKRK